ncbi:MAG: beta-galactosidase [Thermoguttaceae bacterium]|nr:beta-galactosidase [Thermoguttaceae bacterium]
MQKMYNSRLRFRRKRIFNSQFALHSKISLLSIFLLLLTLGAHLPLPHAAAEEGAFRKPSASPYGTCSHLGGGQEHDAMPRNLTLMREAGIEWARADFSWSGIERPQGTWNFEHLDRVVKNAEEQGIHILPILDYSTAWAAPSYKNPELWLEYVRRTVTHFKDRIRYWEVWNEQNLRNFWGDAPDPEEYAKFLRKTYLTIKEIDPELVVVYGGLAGVPAEFYEKSLQAGAGEFFDVMNIHPYRGGLVSRQAIERFLGDIQKFNALTFQYCGKNKPLWITEMGWATPPVLGQNSRLFISSVLERLFPNGVPGKIAVISDGQYPPSFALNHAMWEKMLPENADFELMPLDTAAALDPQTFPALILPPGEDFPVTYADELRNYVKNGGTLILHGGVPFYYQMVRDSDGKWSRPEKSPFTGSLSRTFRVRVLTWWTDKGTPEFTPIELAPNAPVALAKYQVEKLKGSRFLSDSELQEGDTFEPLILPKDAQWTDGPAKGTKFDAPCAGIYRFASDWKGNIAVNAILGDSLGNTNRCVEENQGTYLAQSILLALANGVDRYFSYEFQAVERDDVDPEHHFGIMHADLTPKTGYLAYQALTKARPAGSMNFPGTGLTADPELCLLSWKRPDGLTAYALWSTGGTKEYSLSLSEVPHCAFDVHGQGIELQKGVQKWTLSEKILYVIGKDLKLNVQPN